MTTKNFNFYLLDKEENDWGMNFRIFKKKIDVPDSVDKRQFLKDGSEAIHKAIEEIKEEIEAAKGSEHTFVIKDELRVDMSPTGLLAHIRGVWVGEDFVNSKLKRIVEDITSKNREHTSYCCPLCGKSMLYDKVEDDNGVHCQKCGVYFIIHGIKGIDTNPGDSFSITYLH